MRYNTVTRYPNTEYKLPSHIMESYTVLELFSLAMHQSMAYCPGL